MPAITAPMIEVTQVVTGFLYELSIAEEDGGAGITRVDIGPYTFSGVPPKVSYPESVTNEMCPPDWQPIRWITDERGVSWLRFQGGVLLPEDGEALFQFTSNYAASDNSGTHLVVWETFDVPLPDYTCEAPARNSRHDSTGLGRIYKSSGCMPQIVLSAVAVVAAVVAWHVR
jgi:hypothetical protein